MAEKGDPNKYDLPKPIFIKEVATYLLQDLKLQF
jgi:hypothetical protein